ncbi:hypothetical protein [uncultured Sphingomonas sp.]|uniref:hypothetical protein n=1 Tax=uncultured Sphingomonas sp. TaxID=158754 RepID=UPI0025E8CF2E|nr:hypothetical protein [uncultured Sphingomonas sp.]
MTRTDHEWSLCNPGPGTLLVWVEPWCDEFEVPPSATITLKTPDGVESGTVGEIEWGPENLIIWANGPTVAVFVDDVLQESASAIVPIPNGLTKGMLNTLFAEHPQARLGGYPLPVVATPPWWRRLRNL